MLYSAEEAHGDTAQARAGQAAGKACGSGGRTCFLADS